MYQKKSDFPSTRAKLKSASSSSSSSSFICSIWPNEFLSCSILRCFSIKWFFCSNFVDLYLVAAHLATAIHKKTFSPKSRNSWIAGFGDAAIIAPSTMKNSSRSSQTTTGPFIWNWNEQLNNEQWSVCCLILPVGSFYLSQVTCTRQMFYHLNGWHTNGNLFPVGVPFFKYFSKVVPTWSLSTSTFLDFFVHSWVGSVEFWLQIFWVF